MLARMSETRVVLDGLRFPEGPRWHEGRFWFSDMHAGRVMTLDASGRAETVLTLDDEPSGLGWLPDGRLLVVSMHQRKLLRRDPSGLVVHADLSAVARFHANDMVVDAQGRAYVGNFGFDLVGGAEPRTTNLALVHPGGAVEVAASELLFPNGTVITPDGRTLIVGETFAAQLTAFDIGADGRLSNRRVWAKLERAVPDGICLDAEGAIWVASPVSKGALRVREGGEIVQRIAVEHQAYACMLGGADGRTLHLCTAAHHDPARTGDCRGRIEVARVDVPGAGLP
jgi:sugar lactone lactonase YvrE